MSVTVSSRTAANANFANEVMENHKNRHFPEICIGFKCYNWSFRIRVIKMFVDTEVIGVEQESYVIVLQ